MSRLRECSHSCRRDPANAGDPTFRRPAYDDRPVEAHHFVNHASKQSTLGAGKPRPMQDVKGAWDVARQSVLEAGLMLGVRVTPPDMKV
jgi:hypothetical protein